MLTVVNLQIDLVLDCSTEAIIIDWFGSKKHVPAIKDNQVPISQLRFSERTWDLGESQQTIELTQYSVSSQNGLATKSDMGL